MANLKVINTKNSEKAAEYKIIATNLTTAADILRVAKSLHKSTDDYETIKMSLIKDAILQFLSCFENKGPVNLCKTALYSSNPEQVLFSDLKALRDTWIAHKDGPLRLCEIITIIDPTTGDIVEVGSIHTSPQSIDREIPNLEKLIFPALTFAQQKYEEMIEVTKNEISALHPSQRLRLQERDIATPSSSQFRMGRRKLRNIQSQEAALRPKPKIKK